MPRMLAMLGSVAGKRILDLGSGEGGYARELARREADVVGVDGSARLVATATERARSEPIKVQFLHANASALLGVKSESFDFVVAAMSLMDTGLRRGDPGDVPRPARRWRADHEHHASVLLGARLRVGTRRER